MAQQMTEYCLYGLLHYQRAMDIYRRQQQAEQWTPRDARRADNLRVSILGLGELGQRVAGDLSGMGYVVQGWSRRARQIEGVDCRHGEAGLDQLLTETDVLFCLLPATQDTRHLLDARRLALLPEGAAIINGGRGSLIDEDALLALLDGESLRFAMLDVFAVEPLPSGHPFWKHPRVIITPHVAADTVPADAVAQVAANLRKHAAGLPMDGGVDPGASEAYRVQASDQSLPPVAQFSRSTSVRMISTEPGSQPSTRHVSLVSAATSSRFCSLLRPEKSSMCIVGM
jgi:glyoxylate/hydroxypyruvate reductase A